MPLDDRNLVWRAARRALEGARPRRAIRPTPSSRSRRRFRCRRGSAAAAPTRPRRCRCWRGCGAARRCRCCARSRPGVGSDAPFFLSGGTALGLGRGEEIYPLVDLPASLDRRRPAAVRRVDGRGLFLVRRGPRRRVREPRELQILPVPWPSRAAQMVNDLEPPVIRRHPEIGAIKAALREAGAVAAAMSGQRLGRFRPVPHPPGRRAGRFARSRSWADGHAEPHAVARRARSRGPVRSAPRLTEPAGPG